MSTWHTVTAVGLALVGGLLLMGPPVAGRIVLRNRHKSLRRDLAAHWIETGQVADVVPIDRARSATGFRLANALTEAYAKDPLTDAEVTAVFKAKRETEALPEWATTGTSEMDVLTYAEAEDITTLNEAESAFWADPLFSWMAIPDNAAEHFLPEADRAFHALVDEGVLTGIGADVDTSWKPWSLYDAREPVYA